VLRRHDDLRQQSLERNVNLVLGEPVVKQRGLRADLPGGEQIGDEGDRRGEAQRDRATAPHARVLQNPATLGNKAAQPGPADRLAQVQAHISRRARQQDFVDPFWFKRAPRASGHLTSPSSPGLASVWTSSRRPVAFVQ
jgi:hypothetical protein